MSNYPKTVLRIHFFQLKLILSFNVYIVKLLVQKNCSMSRNKNLFCKEIANVCSRNIL
jgi:hypothetical protein